MLLIKGKQTGWTVLLSRPERAQSVATNALIANIPDATQQSGYKATDQGLTCWFCLACSRISVKWPSWAITGCPAQGKARLFRNKVQGARNGRARTTKRVGRVRTGESHSKWDVELETDRIQQFPRIAAEKNQ